jgi:hypothetical protein
MRTRPLPSILLLAVVGLSSCDLSNPTEVVEPDTVVPLLAKGEKPGQPVLEVDWLLKDTFENSPINLSGVLASMNSRGQSETGLLPVTILGSEGLDFESAFPTLVTLSCSGEKVDPTSWDLDGQGAPLTETTFRDKDEYLDLMVHFNLRTMYENGDINLDTEALCLKVYLANGAALESCRPVKVI